MQIEVLPQPPLLDHHHNFVESWSRDLDLHTSLWQSGIFQSHANSARYIHGQPIIGNEINIVYNHLLFFTLRVSFLLFSFFFFFCLSTLNSTCHLCPRHQISEMLLQRWRSPCNQRFCPKTGEASCPMNGTMKSSSSWIEKISTVVRSHELTSLKVIICAISRWSTHISCHRHISFFFFVLPFPSPFLLFIQSLSITRTHTSSIFLPSSFSTRFQSSDRYTGYPSSFSWPNFFFYPRSIWL